MPDPAASRTAYFDLIGGAAGDMLLGCLLDAGGDEQALRAGLEPLGLSGYTLTVTREQRRGLAVIRAEVSLDPAEEQPHRHLRHVLEILDRGQLPPRVRQRAEQVFRALAEAEGAVHGISPAEVHFHEVGAVDALVDVVGTCLLLEQLGVDVVEAGPFPLAPGQTRAAHGVIPLPAPATLRLLESRAAPVVGRSQGGELVTPTGAAILVALAERLGDWPSLTLERTGYGAGTRHAAADAPPNVVRVALGRAPSAERDAAGEVVVLEANLDDQTAEAVAYLAEALRGQGALEVFLTPVHMKKGRPGLVVTAIGEPAQAGALEDVLLRESTTLGVRRRRQARTVLARSFQAVATPWGPVQVKLTQRPDGRTTAAPEFEDCARLARQHGVPLEAVLEAARAKREP